MRYVDGKGFYTVGEVARAAGVSPQTVRGWERLGYVAAVRTAGGHRLFDDDAVRRVQVVVSSKRRNKLAASGSSNMGVQASVAWSLASTGARVRAARENHGLSQNALAARIGVSRSLLSSIERGVTGVSAQSFSRIAEVLDIPMSSLAPPRPHRQQIMRAGQCPETELAGNVRWLELAAPGHSMAPALLHVPPGQSSGGVMTLARENFITVLGGRLGFKLAELGDWFELSEGDSIVVAAGQTHAWRNDSQALTTVLWVEQLAAGLATDAPDHDAGP